MEHHGKASAFAFSESLGCKRQLLTQLWQLVRAVRGSLGAQQAARHPAKKAGKRDRFRASTAWELQDMLIRAFAHRQRFMLLYVQRVALCHKKNKLENHNNTQEILTKYR